jgi:membrane peptidoglycan carboxypeptidase
VRADEPPRAGPDIGRVDLSEAYAAVRRRANALHRRRIVTSVVAAVVLTGVFSVVGVYYVSSIPLPDALSLPATTTVYFSDGRTVMARLGSQNRVIVDIAALPAHVGDAVVAAEDPGFWDDSGTQISRQYARAATGLDPGRTTDQARALVMAWRLEDSYDKREILGFYLNTVYFGRGAYGIEAAARAYFGKPAAGLGLAEAIVLGGLIESPGDGRFDPTVDAEGARARFGRVALRMVELGSIDESTALDLRVPPVNRYNPAAFQSGLDRPTGLVVAHVLAELRRSEAFRGRPADFIPNGGYSIVTTIDAAAQSLLESVADETVAGSVMDGEPGNLQAAAVVVQPGTGRVLAFYGGHDGTGADFAGWYFTSRGHAVGYGAHPPGQSFQPYLLAAAVDAGISVRSRWDSPATRTFPGVTGPVRDIGPAPCRPTCTLAEAATASLQVPYLALAQRLGVPSVVDAARAAGIRAMWLPDTPTTPRRRVDLAPTGPIDPSASPEPGDSTGATDRFGPDIGLGRYLVTVVDQANGMATFAAGGVRADVHFVRSVMSRGRTVHSERTGATRVLSAAEASDITWTLSAEPAAALPDGRPAAAKTGVWPLRNSAVETAHAWIVGYTASLAMAVWVGNEEIELPLRDKQGSRVLGSGLPARVFRAFLAEAHARLRLPVVPFPTPAFGGDEAAGDAPARAVSVQ